MGKLNRRNFCWCHCGFLAKPGNRYIHGHNKGMLGKYHTEETLIKMRKPHGPMSEEYKQNLIIAMNKLETKAKRALTDATPEVKERRSQVAIELWKDSEFREKILQANSRSETKERRSQSAKEAGNRPKTKEKRSQSVAELWKDPKFREKILQINLRPEVKEKKSQIRTNLWQNPQWRENQLLLLNLPEVKEKQSQTSKKNWEDPEWKKNQLLAIGEGSCILPNKPETSLSLKLNERYPGEMKYTGDFSFTIGGKCPDFVSTNGQKKIIELYGDYWHRNDNPQDRIDLFKQYSYDTLVIWEHELKDLDKLYIKLDEFMRR